MTFCTHCYSDATKGRREDLRFFGDIGVFLSILSIFSNLRSSCMITLRVYARKQHHAAWRQRSRQIILSMTDDIEIVTNCSIDGGSHALALLHLLKFTITRVQRVRQYFSISPANIKLNESPSIIGNSAHQRRQIQIIKVRRKIFTGPFSSRYCFIDDL